MLKQFLCFCLSNLDRGQGQACEGEERERHESQGQGQGEIKAKGWGEDQGQIQLDQTEEPNAEHDLASELVCMVPESDLNFGDSLWFYWCSSGLGIVLSRVSACQAELKTEGLSHAPGSGGKKWQRKTSKTSKKVSQRKLGLHLRSKLCFLQFAKEDSRCLAPGAS